MFSTSALEPGPRSNTAAGPGQIHHVTLVAEASVSGATAGHGGVLHLVCFCLIFTKKKISLINCTASTKQLKIRFDTKTVTERD